MEGLKDNIIVHISDLHLSTDDARRIFKLAAGDIKDFRPALLVVTGDLVDHPQVEVLTRVRDELIKLCKECQIDPSSRLVVVPGNHDYRWFGMLNWECVKKDPFNQIFPDWQSPKFIDLNGRYLAIFGFDSNTNDPKVNFARGRVGEEEYARFNRDYGKLQRNHQTAFNESFKIALLHHHPLPIADTEIDVLTEKDVFLVLEDAGTFMREMVEKRIDLILHGHKHYPFFARAKFVTAIYGEREVTVLGAGSASKPDPSRYGNAYNFIRLKVDGTIEVEQRHRHTGNFRLLLQPTSILSYEGFRDRSYEEALSTKNISVESITYNVLINEFGDGEYSEEYQNCRVKGGSPPWEFLPFDRETAVGIIRGLRAFSRTSTIADPQWVPAEDSTDRHLKGELRFSRPVDFNVGPISFDVYHRIFNNFALSVEQHKRMYGDELPEFFSTLFRFPVRTLFIMIRFPSSIQASSFDVMVQDENGTHKTHEESWCRQHLRISELTRTASLVVPKPLQSHYYGFSWRLPSEARERWGKFPPQIEGNARLIINRLHSLNPSTAPTSMTENLLQGVFEALRQELLEEYPSHDPTEQFDLGLMVYDEEAKRLRHVAGIMRQEYWNWGLCEGEGVAGRAHKLNDALLYVRSRVLPERDWYTRPPGPFPPHEVVLSVPLRYPIERKDGWVVGVLTVASTSPASGLLLLYDNQEEVNTLIDYFHNNCFRERILPALGLSELS